MSTELLHRLICAVSVVGVLASTAWAQTGKPQWNQKMEALSATLSDMLPEIVATKTTPEGKKKLEQGAKKLSNLVHALAVQPGGMSILPPDADPTLGFIRDSFERELKRASGALARGNTDYGRALLRNTMQYCIACHSRNDLGPQFPSLKINPNLEKLSAFEKAEILGALRQFDASLVQYEGAISDATFVKKRQLDWIRAVNQALAISVRVKRDPERALKLVSETLTAPIPEYYAKNLRAWKVSLEEWKQEMAKGQPALSDAAALMNEARRLFTKASSTQKYPMDHAGDIYFLRASAVLHQLLRVAPTGSDSSEALYLLGRSYEVMADPTLWPMHETYYESCVRSAPHTARALECYTAYEESIFFGYSGSGGFSLPEVVQGQLADLKKLAVPKTSKP